MNMTKILKRKLNIYLLVGVLLITLLGSTLAVRAARRAPQPVPGTATTVALTPAETTPVVPPVTAAPATPTTPAAPSAERARSTAEISRGGSRPQAPTDQSQLPAGVKWADYRLLAHLIFAEAGIEPYSGQVAVGAVVLNRTHSNQFPNTIAGVIYQTGQFEPVGNYYFNSEPSESAKQAALEALRGSDPSYGALYFFDPSKVTNNFLWSRPLTVTIGGHRFTK